MTSLSPDQDLTAAISDGLPYLRRYARALTGSQASGDAYAAATLEAILADRALFDRSMAPRVALFRAMHRLWHAIDLAVPAAPVAGIEAKAQAHLAKLTANSREALLLATIEGFSRSEIGQIMSRDEAAIGDLIDVAHREMASSVAGRVLIVEDEAIIAIDLQNLVSEMGHVVTGVARTHSEALQLARADRPGLILADIQLADKSSGIDAVNDVMAELGDIPVIFITAFPERLLTGKRPEPAFLISKPYEEAQVRSAVGQAMFFASTETLVA